MKYAFFSLLLLLLLFNINIQAQIKFMNIPIDGSPSEFSDKMKAKGFKVSNREPNIIYMKGKYWGENAYICIESTPITNLVYDITVLLSPHNSWQALYNKYKVILKKTTSLYGNPSTEDEYFDYPYDSNNPIVKMAGVENSACHFWKCYYIDNGYVMVLIHPSMRVTISYCNEDNEIKAKQEE